MPVIPAVLFPYVSTYRTLLAAANTPTRAIPVPVAAHTHAEVAALVTFLQFHSDPAPGSLAAALKLKAEVDLAVAGGADNAQDFPANLIGLADRIDDCENTFAQRLASLQFRVNQRLDNLEHGEEDIDVVERRTRNLEDRLRALEDRIYHGR